MYTMHVHCILIKLFSKFSEFLNKINKDNKYSINKKLFLLSFSLYFAKITIQIFNYNILNAMEKYYVSLTAIRIFEF